MGPPLTIINHSKKEYIRFTSTLIGSEELALVLPFYIHIILSGRWSPTDIIGVENICDDDELLNELKCIHTIK